MNYSDLVSIVGERNRPSGGLRTIATFCRESRLGAQSTVLEVGCNTGFAATNIALLTQANVVGVDIDARSVEQARAYARDAGVSHRVRFELMDALALSYSGEGFDAVWVSNVPSFTERKTQMIEECARVLRFGGYLGIAPIYYVREPPEELVAEVSQLIGARVGNMSREAWLEMIETHSYHGAFFHETYREEGAYLDAADRLNAWCNARVAASAALAMRSSEERAHVAAAYLACLQVFYKNLSYCNFMLSLWQKRAFRDEPELFLTCGPG